MHLHKELAMQNMRLCVEQLAFAKDLFVCESPSCFVSNIKRADRVFYYTNVGDSHLTKNGTFLLESLYHHLLNNAWRASAKICQKVSSTTLSAKMQNNPKVI